jgi:hypothetical protein
MKNLLIIILLTSYTISVFCMEPSASNATGVVEINGQTKPLIDHIIQFMKGDVAHLKHVDFVRYGEEKDPFVIIASENLMALSSDETRQIEEGNFVYYPNYRISPESEKYVPRHAVIVGTKDERDGMHLAMSCLKRTLLPE